MSEMIENGQAVELPEAWLAHSSCVDEDHEIKDEYRQLLARKKEVLFEWGREKNALGKHGETIIGDAFRDAGYLVTRNVLFEHGSTKFEVDLLCLKEGLPPLSVEVKNSLSEVIIDPGIFEPPNDLHAQIENEFKFGKEAGIIPVLFAPFVDRSFYVCCDRHSGLFCQTYLQLLPPEDAELCERIRNDLHFGNVKAVSEVPAHVSRWINSIPEMWRKRHSSLTL
jgi:hypothetical protein